MVDLRGLYVTGHMSFAHGANICIPFLLPCAVFHGKCTSTHFAMVDLSGLHIAGYLCFAHGANVNIDF